MLLCRCVPNAIWRDNINIFNEDLLVLIDEENLGGFCQRTSFVGALQHPVRLPVEDEASKAQRQNDTDPCRQCLRHVALVSETIL